ncbi:Sec16 protein [Martiniozyma asiatica (nom. inval.)]|nr:Sec16 protein [Martiniozyma asiatica]
MAKKKGGKKKGKATKKQPQKIVTENDDSIPIDNSAALEEPVAAVEDAQDVLEHSETAQVPDLHSTEHGKESTDTVFVTQVTEEVDNDLQMPSDAMTTPDQAIEENLIIKEPTAPTQSEPAASTDINLPDVEPKRVFVNSQEQAIGAMEKQENVASLVDLKESPNVEKKIDFEESITIRKENDYVAVEVGINSTHEIEGKENEELLLKGNTEEQQESHSAVNDIWDSEPQQETIIPETESQQETITPEIEQQQQAHNEPVTDDMPWEQPETAIEPHTDDVPLENEQQQQKTNEIVTDDMPWEQQEASIEPPIDEMPWEQQEASIEPPIDEMPWEQQEASIEPPIDEMPWEIEQPHRETTPFKTEPQQEAHSEPVTGDMPWETEQQAVHESLTNDIPLELQTSQETFSVKEERMPWDELTSKTENLESNSTSQKQELEKMPWESSELHDTSIINEKININVASEQDFLDDLLDEDDLLDDSIERKEEKQSTENDDDATLKMLEEDDDFLLDEMDDDFLDDENDDEQVNTSVIINPQAVQPVANFNRSTVISKQLNRNPYTPKAHVIKNIDPASVMIPQPGNTFINNATPRSGYAPTPISGSLNQMNPSNQLTSSSSLVSTLETQKQKSDAYDFPTNLISKTKKPAKIVQNIYTQVEHKNNVTSNDISSLPPPAGNPNLSASGSFNPPRVLSNHSSRTGSVSSKSNFFSELPVSSPKLSKAKPTHLKNPYETIERASNVSSSLNIKKSNPYAPPSIHSTPAQYPNSQPSITTGTSSTASTIISQTEINIPARRTSQKNPYAPSTDGGSLRQIITEPTSAELNPNIVPMAINYANPLGITSANQALDSPLPPNSPMQDFSFPTNKAPANVISKPSRYAPQTAQTLMPPNKPAVRRTSKPSRPSVSSINDVYGSNIVKSTASSTHRKKTSILPPGGKSKNSSKSISFTSAPVVVNPENLIRRQWPLFAFSSEKFVSMIPNSSGYGTDMCNFDIVDLGNILKDDLSVSFPGPLIKNKTKRKDIIKWLEDKQQSLHVNDIYNSPCELIWPILKVMLEHINKEGDFCDNENYKKALINILNPNLSVNSENNNTFDIVAVNNIVSSLSSNRPTNAYQVDSNGLSTIHEFLQSGNKREALEMALSVGDWALSLLIANLISEVAFTQVMKLYTNANFGDSAVGSNMGFFLQSAIEGAITTENLKGKEDWIVDNYKTIFSFLLLNRSDSGKLLLQISELLADSGNHILSKLAGIISGKPLIPFSLETLPVSIDAMIIEEIYEYILLSSDNISSQINGLPHLLPVKIRHAGYLADFGHAVEAKKYADFTQSVIAGKQFFVDSGALIAQDQLQNRVCGIEQSGWLTNKLSKPNLNSVWSTFDKQFNKFVAGDEADQPEPPHDGLFSKFATTPSVSRANSVLDIKELGAHINSNEKPNIISRNSVPAVPSMNPYESVSRGPVSVGATPQFNTGTPGGAYGQFVVNNSIKPNVGLQNARASSSIYAPPSMTSPTLRKNSVTKLPVQGQISMVNQYARNAKYGPVTNNIPSDLNYDKPKPIADIGSAGSSLLNSPKNKQNNPFNGSAMPSSLASENNQHGSARPKLDKTLSAQSVSSIASSKKVHVRNPYAPSASGMSPYGSNVSLSQDTSVNGDTAIAHPEKAPVRNPYAPSASGMSPYGSNVSLSQDTSVNGDTAIAHPEKAPVRNPYAPLASGVSPYESNVSLNQNGNTPIEDNSTNKQSTSSPILVSEIKDLPTEVNLGYDSNISNLTEGVPSLPNQGTINDEVKDNNVEVSLTNETDKNFIESSKPVNKSITESNISSGLAVAQANKGAVRRVKNPYANAYKPQVRSTKSVYAPAKANSYAPATVSEDPAVIDPADALGISGAGSMDMFTLGGYQLPTAQPDSMNGKNDKQDANDDKNENEDASEISAEGKVTEKDDPSPEVDDESVNSVAEQPTIPMIPMHNSTTATLNVANRDYLSPMKNTVFTQFTPPKAPAFDDTDRDSLSPIHKITESKKYYAESTGKYYDDVIDDDDDDDDDDAAAEENLKKEEERLRKEKEEEERKKKQKKEEELKKKEEEKKNEDKSNGGSWFGGLFGGNKEGKKVYKAKLGEQNSFYYDEKLGKWINSKIPLEEQLKDSAPPPPPMKKSTGVGATDTAGSAAAVESLPPNSGSTPTAFTSPASGNGMPPQASAKPSTVAAPIPAPAANINDLLNMGASATAGKRKKGRRYVEFTGN